MHVPESYTGNKWTQKKEHRVRDDKTLYISIHNHAALFKSCGNLTGTKTSILIFVLKAIVGCQ